MARATKHKSEARTSKHKFRARAVKYKLVAKAGKHKLGTRPGKYKPGPRPVNTNWKPGQRTGAGGQGQKQGQGNTNTLLITLGKQRDQESIALTSSNLGSLYFPALALCLASRPGRGSQFLFTGPGS